jgi:hypothetical protein
MKSWHLRAWLFPCLLFVLFLGSAAGPQRHHLGRSTAGNGLPAVPAKRRRSHSEAARGGRPSKKTESPVQWRVLAPPDGKRVEVGRFVAWCPGIGRPKPRISRVSESDQGRRVLLTAYLIHRTRGQCGRVAVLVSHTVILRRPLGGRKLYDASVHPAVKRWPRPAR